MTTSAKRINIASKKTFAAVFFALFILCLGARLTGLLFHQLLGLVFIAFALIHCLVHSGWFFSFSLGRWTIRRVVTAVINFLLFFCTLILFVTGVYLSPDLFSFLQLHSSMTTRSIHSIAAFWTLVLIGIHLGLHAQIFIRALSKYLSSGAIYFLAILLSAFGVIGFVDRMLFEKLFLGFSFDFWDESKPLVLYFVLYAAVSLMVTVFTELVLEISHRKNAVFRKSFLGVRDEKMH